MNRRRVRPEELELWSQVARSAEPLTTKPAPGKTGPRTFDSTDAPSGGLAKPTGGAAPIAPFSVGDKSPPRSETHIFPQTTADHLHAAPVRMDTKALTRLKRGKLAPEARMDLHGMTLDRAHGALTQFILGAHTRGLRLVLVITGKGSREDPYDPAPRRRGVLRTQVPQWLSMPPLAGAVLQVVPAHRKHGGEGAYYVYLRRVR